jgi:HEAT-like repeat
MIPYLMTVVYLSQYADWRERESAILALGAISEGCAEGLQPYIPSMVEMLLPKVSDPRPLVRSISCWALSRYSSWVVRASGDSGGPGQQQFESVLQVRGVLRLGLSFAFYQLWRWGALLCQWKIRCSAGSVIFFWRMPFAWMA